MNGFAKKDYVKVKNVINPTSGVSYNPNFDSHQNLLKEVVEKEEEIIKKSQKELKVRRPFLFKDEDNGD